MDETPKASVTTENITPNEYVGVPRETITIGGNGAVMHNHGSNFGRYVVGCPACIKKYPDGPPEKRQRAKPGHKYEPRTAANSDIESMPTLQAAMAARSVPTAHPVTGNDLIEAIKSLQADQRDALIAFARELKAPDPEEEAKRTAEKERKSRAREEEVRIMKEAALMKQQVQMACERYGHRKENGRSAINGQVHSDGLFHPLCVHCGKEFPAVRPTADQMPSGVTLNI